MTLSSQTALSCFISLLTFSVTAQIKETAPIATEASINHSSYTGIISERYANGAPSLLKTLLDGKANGLWLEWFPNGVLRYRAYWKNDLGHGKWEYFYPNGNLKNESFYIDDVAQGIYRSYFENGQLEYDGTYLDGRKHGIAYTYDINGSLVSRERFENDTLIVDEPVIFEQGTISSLNGNEWGIHFTQEDNKAYFTRRDGETGEKRIYVTEKKEGNWTVPTIASFSTDEDESPFISSDGAKLFFASYRRLPDGSTTQPMDMNIWCMDQKNGEWSAPKPLPKEINKSMKKGDVWPANYEAGPMVDQDGNLYFWTKGTENNGTNLYFSKLKADGHYDKPRELIEPSNHGYFDTAPHLSPDGKLLFFSSDDRYDGYGGGDIYYSKKIDGKWSSPKNLGPVVNSSRSEGSPSFSVDGKYFFFSSNRGELKDANGESLWNIYYMEASYLMIE